MRHACSHPRVSLEFQIPNPRVVFHCIHQLVVLSYHMFVSLRWSALLHALLLHTLATNRRRGTRALARTCTCSKCSFFQSRIRLRLLPSLSSLTARAGRVAGSRDCSSLRGVPRAALLLFCYSCCTRTLRILQRESRDRLVVLPSLLEKGVARVCWSSTVVSQLNVLVFMLDPRFATNRAAGSHTLQRHPSGWRHRRVLLVFYCRVQSLLTKSFPSRRIVPRTSFGNVSGVPSTSQVSVFLSRCLHSHQAWHLVVLCLSPVWILVVCVRRWQHTSQRSLFSQRFTAQQSAMFLQVFFRL